MQLRRIIGGGILEGLSVSWLHDIQFMEFTYPKLLKDMGLSCSATPFSLNGHNLMVKFSFESCTPEENLIEGKGSTCLLSIFIHVECTNCHGDRIANIGAEI